MRMLSLTLGSTTLAGTLILSVFFSGFALGSIWLGCLVDRVGSTLLLYALLEIGLGIFALFSLSILRWGDLLFLFFQRTGLQDPLYVAIKFALLWLILLPSTIVMVSTLPVVSKYLVRHVGSSGKLVGRLYAFNTLGAVLGTALTAFVLIRFIGISATVNIAAISNITLGFLVLALRQTALNYKIVLMLWKDLHVKTTLR